MGKKRRKRVSCPNCSSKLRDDMNFCFNCGQENHIKRVSIKMLAADFTSTYFSVDSKLLQSLKYLLLKPSFLSLEYLNGKIEAYLRPIRLYVFISFSFFLLWGVVSSNDLTKGLTFKNDGKDVSIEEVREELNKPKDTNDAIQTDFSGTESFLDGKLERIFSDEKEMNSFVVFAKSKSPILFFFLIPLFAFLLFLFFYKKEYYFVDHLVFALHLQSFLFVMLIVSTIIDWVFKIDTAPLAVLGLLIYGFIAALRFYKRKWFTTFIRLSLTGIVYTFFGSIFFVVFFLLLVNYYVI